MSFSLKHTSQLIFNPHVGICNCCDVQDTYGSSEGIPENSYLLEEEN